MLLFECEMARQRRQQANLAEMIAVGYGGCKSKHGARALQEIVHALRKRE